MAHAVNLLAVAHPEALRASPVRAVVTTASAGFTASLAASMPALELVASLGAGLDRIEALPPRVRVVAVGGYLTEDVADLAMALMLMANRMLVAADRFVRGGAWAQGAFPPGRGLAGRTLGLLGYGQIGRAIARRGAAAHMKVVAHTPTPRGDVAWCETPRALAGASDVLVLCCPGGEATRGLVGAAELHALGGDGVLVNVSRGSVVDEAALIAALKNGVIAAAGLDVFGGEPSPDPRLLALSNVVLTPHIGGATWDARARAGASASAVVLEHFGLAAAPHAAHP
jgi:lactate dehydrogenase-like 2-hydroxyacid dehydrogenase